MSSDNPSFSCLARIDGPGRHGRMTGRGLGPWGGQGIVAGGGPVRLRRKEIGPLDVRRKPGDARYVADPFGGNAVPLIDGTARDVQLVSDLGDRDAAGFQGFYAERLHVFPRTK